MRHANIVSGVVLAAFGLAMLFVVIPWQIEPGPQGMLSPRLVPNLMMIAITGLAVLLVVTSLREAAKGQADSEFPITRAELAAMLKLGAVFALALGLFMLVSPLAAGVVLVAGVLMVLGERRPFVIVSMPAALLIVLWFVFYKVLGTAIV